MSVVSLRLDLGAGADGCALPFSAVLVTSGFVAFVDWAGALASGWTCTVDGKLSPLDIS